MAILSKPSSRGTCIKILKMLCVGACMKILLGCSQEVLVWGSWEIFYIDYKEGPAAAVAIMSSPHLLLFHSYCRLYLVHWLPTPPTLFSVSCRCSCVRNILHFSRTLTIKISWPNATRLTSNTIAYINQHITCYIYNAVLWINMLVCTHGHMYIYTCITNCTFTVDDQDSH